MSGVSQRVLRKRRSIVVLLLSLLVLVLQSLPLWNGNKSAEAPPQNDVLSESETNGESAAAVLERLAIKGRAPKTGYERAEFGDSWARVGDCDVRNIMLKRYLRDIEVGMDGCTVLSGTLDDMYTGKTLPFVRGSTTSDEIQIDHVVALSDAWQKGAQGLSYERRVQFANDPLNLIPVEGRANQDKGDSDAASWLPPNKAFRCRYVARQVAVKDKYALWVTEAEKAAMKRVLNGCPEQGVPVETSS